MADILYKNNFSARINQLLNKLSLFIVNLKFTIEMELNNETPFLNVLLNSREGTSVRRSICRKITWYGQYINFCSSPPLSVKKILIRCLNSKAKRIFTDGIDDTELQSVKRTCVKMVIQVAQDITNRRGNSQEDSHRVKINAHLFVIQR